MLGTCENLIVLHVLYSGVLVIVQLLILLLVGYYFLKSIKYTLCNY
jgi:hypothetical protein